MTMMNDLWIEELSHGEYRIGLSEQLQEDAGDIEFVNIHKPGEIHSQAILVNIEASKAAIEIPIEFDAEIKEINEAALEQPSLLNETSHDKNWVAIMTVNDVEQVKTYL